jgi:hypothetical protein
VATKFVLSTDLLRILDKAVSITLVEGIFFKAFAKQRAASFPESVKCDLYLSKESFCPFNKTR